MAGSSGWQRVGVLLVLFSALGLVSCGKSVQGTYSNENGAVLVELRSGGEGAMTFMGETRPCTYKVEGDKLSLDCKGDTFDFTIHDDQSLTGPPGSMVGALRKSK